MKSLLAVAFACFFVVACDNGSGKPKSTMTNKAKAVALLESLETGDQEPASYINPNKYIQHNLGVADGLAGFGAVLQNQPPGGFKAKVVRAFEDGNYVFTHTEYDFFGPKTGFDIFRFENGLIVEHWDNLQETTAVNISGRSQSDGPTEIVDLNKTDENKAMVQGFVTDVLMGAAPEKITAYVSTETYLQHNPSVGDGLEALGAAIGAMADAGTPMVYEKNHFVLGEGNFVLTASDGQFLGGHVAFYDLFRIADGKIVEHWDTVESIPAQSEWKNDNGKF